MSSNPFRLLSRFLAVFILILTTGSSLMVAAPVAASTADDKATDSADCSPVAIDKDEWEDYGLIGRREYESPQFGVGADWDRDWVVDEEADFPITSNEDCEYDLIRLLWEDGDHYGLLTLNFGTPADVDAMEDLTDHWSSDDFLTTQWRDNYVADVVVSNADDIVAEALFTLENEDDGTVYYVIYRTIALSDDAWLYLTYTTDKPSLEDAWAALEDGVRVDGDVIPSALTWRKIERAL
ncbi:MAG: hypothetical protein QM753_17340 [Thermomicrobiales bacterium]